MKKTTLDVNTLRVESFETGEARGERGTVWAHGGECTVAPYPSCGLTCGNPPSCTDHRNGVARTMFACCV